MATGTLTGLQHRCYNGGWNSWTTVGSASQYIGSANKYPYCLKFTVPNDNIINATLTFSFNIVKGSTSTGSSGTITWDIRTAGPATGTSKQGSSITSGTWSVSGITASSQQKTFSTSVISSLSKGATYYLWLTSDVLFQAYKDSDIPHYGGSISYTNYTACSAPTAITASGIVTPSGTFTISWSGASGGTNNAISSYQIYWKVSSDGSAPTTSSYTGTKNIASTSTSGSTSITLSSAQRGYKVVCGIVTQGTAGASYYSGIKTGGSVKINLLPAKPTVVSTNTTVVSTSGTEVIFNVMAGSDSDGQNCTLYYATSSTESKTKFTSPLSKTLNAAATYYFYTYDGIEYSSPTSISIALNTKPVINNIEVNTISTYTALNSNGISEYRKGYADTIQPKITANKGGTLKIMVEMSGSNSTTSTTSYDYTYILPDYNLTSYDNVILNTYDINTAAVNKFSEEIRQSTNIKWRLKFILTDGIDDSDAKYFPANGYFYTIAHSPSLDVSFNRFADSKVPGTIATQIWREVRMKFYNDTSTPIVSVTATTTTDDGKEISLNTTFTTSVSGNNRYVDITLPDNIKSEATINITASLTNASASITKKVSCTVTETPAPNMGSLTHGGPIIYPFTDIGTYQISMAWPFGNYKDINTALTAYNCSTNIDNAIKFVHASDTSGSNLVIKELKKQNQVTWEKNNNGINDTITATLDGKTAYGWKNELGQNELGYDTYAGQKTYYCQIQITNLFGKTYTSDPESGGWLSRIFDFNEKAQSLKIESIQWATSNNPVKWESFTTGSNGNAAQESMYFKFNLKFNLFTKEAITIQLKRKINNEENISISKTYPSGSSELTYASNQTAETNTVSLIYGPVGTISDTEKRVWSFQITNTRGTTESDGVEMKVQRQTAPDINFTSCSVNYNSDEQKYKIKYSFEQIDNGGGSITNYLYDYDKKTNLTVQLNKPSSGQIWSDTVDSNATNWEVKSICIKSVSTVNGLIKLEKEYYSNYIIVYKVSPTVAYRKNQLGINTDSPDSEYIIDIRPTSNYKKVRLYDGISDIIELDLSKVYNNDNNASCPAIVVKKETNEGTSKKITEYTLFFD